jgi:hypothetical protein
MLTDGSPALQAFLSRDLDGDKLGSPSTKPF